MRALICTGDSSRRISSTAFGHNSGRAAKVSMLRRVEKHPNSVAQQVDCGLEPGSEHQSGECLQFVAVEARALVGGLDDLAHQIVAGIAAQLFQMIGQPAVESHDALVHLLELLP